MPAKVCVEFTESDGENPPVPAPQFRTYAATIGDGTSLTYALTHDLGTADVLYSLRNLTTGVLDGDDVTVISQPNTLGLTFAAAPATGSIRVVVGAVAA